MRISISRQWDIYLLYLGLAGLIVNLTMLGLAYMGGGLEGVYWLLERPIFLVPLNVLLLFGLLSEVFKDDGAVLDEKALTVRTPTGKFVKIGVEDIVGLKFGLYVTKIICRSGKSVRIYPWILSRQVVSDLVIGDESDN